MLKSKSNAAKQQQIKVTPCSLVFPAPLERVRAFFRGFDQRTPTWSLEFTGLLTWAQGSHVHMCFEASGWEH
eukprot:2387393-Pyramimonas_sp.AAC.1